MVEIGSISIFLAFIISVYVLVASVYGARTKKWDFVKSAENGAIAVLVLLIIATIVLLNSLLNLDFSLKYVALNTSTDLATIYRITSLIQSRNKDRKLMPYVLATLATVSIFFIGIIAFVESPFEKLPFIPLEGRGLNPILQNGYMAIHPLTLYFGYVGVTVPFAFGMGLGMGSGRECSIYALACSYRIHSLCNDPRKKGNA